MEHSILRLLDQILHFFNINPQTWTGSITARKLAKKSLHFQIFGKSEIRPPGYQAVSGG